MSDHDKERHVRISMESPRGEMGISCLTKEDSEKLKRAFVGLEWITAEGGRLVSSPRVNSLPGPADDEAMLPFWRPFSPRREQGEGTQYEAKIFEKHDFKHTFPSFAIQHLCGYYYTPERYREEAERLVSWGFECMRSRRGVDGKYWEVWFLPSLWCAKGAFREAIESKENVRNDQTEKALEFIRRNASFGTLDISVQRLAMTADD